MADSIIVGKAVSKSIYQFDPMLGFWGRPNVSCVVLSDHLTDEETPINHNEDGIRDIPFVASDRKGSIVCIGGSHTWGGGIQQQNRYSEKLAELTGRRVVNMGHASLGLDQACLAILDRSAKYKPDIVVVEQYPWAVVRVFNSYVNGYVKPVFEIDQQGNLKLKKVPKLARYRMFRRIIGAYYGYNKELSEYRSGIDLAQEYDPMTDPIFLYWKSAYYEQLFDRVGKIIGILDDYCRRNSIKLIFGLGAIYQQFQEPLGTSLVDVNIPRLRLAKILSEKRIAYVDMTNRMMANHTPEDPVIFTDGHINRKGHRVFAEALYDDLTNRGWL